MTKLHIEIPQRFSQAQREAVRARYRALCLNYPNTTSELKVCFYDAQEAIAHGIRVIGGSSGIAAWLWNELTDAARSQRGRT